MTRNARTNRVMWMLFTAVLLIGPIAHSAADDRPHEKTFTLTEHIDRDWSDELVGFPFEAERGQCHPDSVALFDGDGQRVPVQLSAIEYWPGTEHVQSAKVWFVADLPALTEIHQTLHYGPDAVADEAPASDLRVEQGENVVALTTDGFGVRLLHGSQTYDEPRQPADVPAPVDALRLSDGTWFGGSQWYGEAPIEGYDAELVAAGPVFAEVAIQFHYAGGATFRLNVHMAARDHQASWSMSMDEKLEEMAGAST